MYKEGQNIGVYTIVKRIDTTKNGRPSFILSCSVCGSTIGPITVNTMGRWKPFLDCHCNSPQVKCKSYSLTVGGVYGIYRVLSIHKLCNHNYVRIECLECGHTKNVRQKEFIDKWMSKPHCDCKPLYTKPYYVSENHNYWNMIQADLSLNEYVGKVVNGWIVEDVQCYTRKKTNTKIRCFTVKCLECGRVCKSPASIVKGQKLPACNHNHNTYEVIQSNEVYDSKVHRLTKLKVDYYLSFIGQTIGNFFVYDLKIIKSPNSNFYRFRVICIKCGTCRSIPCNAFLKELNIEHKCHPICVGIKKYRKFSSDKDKCYDRLSYIKREDFSDLYNNFLSEYSLVSNTPLFMECYAQASIDGKLDCFKEEFGI